MTFAWEGAVAIVSAAEAGMYGSTRYPTFRVDEAKCVPQFILNYFKTDDGLQQLVKICPGSAGRNRVLSIKRIPEVLVPLPPLAEQRRVVARIEGLAANIEEARGLRKQAAEEADALVTAEARKALSFRAGDGWRSLSVESCCEAIIDYRGRTPPIAEEGIPHLTSANIRNGQINWNTTRFVSKDTYDTYMTRGLPTPGDIIFTMEVPLGEAAVVPDERLFSLAQRTLLLRPNRNLVQPQYLARVLASPDVHETIYAKATGTTVKGIASKRLKQVPLPVPPLSEQRRIVAYMDDLQKQSDALKALQAETSKELDALMPSILVKAFQGEL